MPRSPSHTIPLQCSTFSSILLFSLSSEFPPCVIRHPPHPLPVHPPPMTALSDRPLLPPTDCNVYPVSEDVATPKVSFSAAGEVLVGLLPQVPGEVLADLTLTITTSSTNTVLRVRRDNPKTVECWRGSYLMKRYENLPSFATEDPYEWLHVPVSLNESKILLNSLEVCPGLKVNGSNPTLVISTLKQANVVFNCQEGKFPPSVSQARFGCVASTEASRG